MLYLRKISFFLLLCFFSASIMAREIAGVTIAETITLAGQSKSLILNGAGIRTKFIFDIYVAALYLEKKADSVQKIAQQSGEKSVQMFFLYDEVSKEKLISGWNSGFENNLTKQQFQQMKVDLKQFNSFFHGVKKGDIIKLNFIPAQGTSVVINNKIMGNISNNNFFNALLSVWLGDDPADEDLKNAMLSHNDN